MRKIEIAQTKWNDLLGTAALDFNGNDSNGILDYAKDMDIDIDKFYPIGLSFYVGENDNFCLKFFCVDNKNKELYMITNNGVIPIIVFNKKENLKSFLKWVKRFEVVFNSLDSELQPHSITTEYNIDNEII